MYYESDTLAFNVYYGCCGTPDANTLAGIWEQHRPALLKFLTMSTKGSHGEFMYYFSIDFI